MTYVNPGGEYVRLHGPPQGIEDVLRYAAFLRSAAGLSDQPPIDLSKIYRRFGMPTPRRADLPGQQGLLLNPGTGQFVINQNDVATRQRFTEAHELMELLFSQAPKRLRVVWAIGKDGAPYTPTHSSVGEATSIYRAWESGVDTEGEDHLELGALRGRCRCENRAQQVEGERVVLSLVHLPGDEGCSGAAVIGEDEELPF